MLPLRQALCSKILFNLLTNRCSVNRYFIIHLLHDFFSVVVYGCESWIIKKAECGRIDAFELFGEDS